MTTRSVAVLWQDLDAAEFAWHIPDRLNIATACLDDQRAEDVALIVDDGGPATRFTFGELTRLSRRFAGLLEALGIGAGDRVGVMVPQGAEVVTAHLGSFRAGAVTVPLSVKFGPEAVVYRLRHSGARLLVIDAANFGRVREALAGVETLRTVLVVGHAPARAGDTADVLPFDEHLRHNGIRGHRRHRRGLPRHHHLHLGNHRPAQGGAARASHPARAHAGGADRVRQRTAAR